VLAHAAYERFSDHAAAGRGVSFLIALEFEEGSLRRTAMPNVACDATSLQSEQAHPTAIAPDLVTSLGCHCLGIA
jgi:hypothetical protein